jgi:enterochelin esterase-like enzyme
MGAGQTLNSGLKHLDKFSWLGAFSGGGGKAANLITDEAAVKKLRLFWISSGDKDQLAFKGSESLHNTLKEKNIPHVWHIDSGGHTWPVWKNDLYLIAQMLFRDKGDPAQPGQPVPGKGGGKGGKGGKGGFGGPIKLGPDDKQAFPDPPTGFNVSRDNIPHGDVKVVEYDSKTLGTRRQMRVYTPPGYKIDEKYPVLYILHGLGNTSTEWTQRAKTPQIVDNLLADGKIQPIIIIFPSGDAKNTVENPKPGREAAGYGKPFEEDLLKDIIPYVDSHYSVRADRNSRALAGMSMGGGQSLNIGLSHVDTFAWVGAIAPAPNTRSPAQLVPDPAALKKLKLLWLSCGNKDGLIRVSQGVHSYLKEQSVPHIYNVDGNGHDSAEMSNNLYHFAQRIFTE